MVTSNSKDTLSHCYESSAAAVFKKEKRYKTYVVSVIRSLLKQMHVVAGSRFL